MRHWNQSNKVACGIFLVVFTVYGLLVVYLYNHYLNKTAETKHDLLTKYYGKILDLTENKIKLLYADILASPDDKTTITVQNHNLEVCANTKCTRYNLFKFESSLKKIIPEFINCRIELGEDLIYSNTRSGSYQLEKDHSFGQYLKINVGIGINDDYWSKEEGGNLATFLDNLLLCH